MYFVSSFLQISERIHSALLDKFPQVKEVLVRTRYVPCRPAERITSPQIHVEAATLEEELAHIAASGKPPHHSTIITDVNLIIRTFPQIQYALPWPLISVLTLSLARRSSSRCTMWARRST